MAKPPASTQRHLKLAQIRDDMVVMKDGTLRAVIVVSAVNFALKSQPEQEAIIYQFQNFLNGLTMPLQITVQSRQLELNNYLENLANKAKEQTNDLLRFQMVDYIDFVSRLITLANIMEKRFFVVVSHQTVNSGSTGALGFILGGRKTTPKFTRSQIAHYRGELTERVNVVISGLAGIGLRAAQLNTQQLVEFFYGLYNPEEASTEKLIDANELHATVVSHPSPRP